MVLGLLGACIIGLPVGYALTIPAKIGVSGMLMAGDIGIGLAGAALLHRWHKKLKEALHSAAPLATPLSSTTIVTNTSEREWPVAAPVEEKVPLPQPLLLSSGAKSAAGSPSITQGASETCLEEQEQQSIPGMKAPSRKSRCSLCVIL